MKKITKGPVVIKEITVYYADINKMPTIFKEVLDICESELINNFIEIKYKSKFAKKSKDEDTFEVAMINKDAIATVDVSYEQKMFGTEESWEDDLNDNKVPF